MDLERVVKVLYVEDDKMHVQLIQDMLKACKHTKFVIEHRGDLESSIKYLKSVKCNVDVVLLDLMLPNSQGVKTFEKIFSACVAVPVVIISGFEDIAYKCISLGAQDYLVKPNISPGSLCRSIVYAIERRKLQILERQFARVISSTPLGVHMYKKVGDDLIFCGYNDAANKILKLNHEELMDLKIEEAFPDSVNSDVKKQYMRVIETGGQLHISDLPYKDDRFDGRFKIHAFRIDYDRMATTFEDITEKAKMEDALKRSEERFKLLSVASFEGVAITREGIVVDVNDQFCWMLQANRDDVIGQEVIKFVAPQDRKKVLRNLQNNIEDPYEHIARRTDGSLFPVEVHGKTLPDGLRLTAVRDMSRYKEAEKKIESSQKKYREIVEVTKAAIYEVDFIKDRFVYVNDVVSDLTGWSKEELMEMKATDLLTEKSFNDFSERMAALQKGDLIDPSFEYEITAKDGSKRWTMITVRFKEDEKGKAIGANVVAIDITDKKLAEKAAMEKEKYIFEELERRIRVWKDEIAADSIKQKNTIRDVSLNIEKITKDNNGVEVH